MIHCKRYALFQFDRYEACGGAWDFVGMFDSAEEAMAAFKPRDTDNRPVAHVFDLLTEKVVFFRGGPPNTEWTAEE